jgi:hypothetical protein
VVEERPPSRQGLMAFALDMCSHEGRATRRHFIDCVTGSFYTYVDDTDGSMKYFEDAAPGIDAHACKMLRQVLQLQQEAAEVEAAEPALAAAREAAARAKAKLKAAEVTGAAVAVGAALAEGKAAQEALDAAQKAADERKAVLESKVSQAAELFMSVGAKSPQLLPQLAEVFGAAPAATQAALFMPAVKLARALGPLQPGFLSLLQQQPAGCSKLLLHMVAAHVMPGDEAAASIAATGQPLPPSAAAAGPGLQPPRQLVDACLAHFHQHKEPLFVALVAGGLTKPEAAKLLPRLLDLPGPAVRALYKRLTEVPAGGAAGLFSPAELLVALNRLDPKAAGLPMKVLIAAVDVALHAPETFPQQVSSSAAGRKAPSCACCACCACCTAQHVPSRPVPAAQHVPSRPVPAAQHSTCHHAQLTAGAELTAAHCPCVPQQHTITTGRDRDTTACLPACL